MSIFHHFYSGALFNIEAKENCCFRTGIVLKNCENYRDFFMILLLVKQLCYFKKLYRDLKWLILMFYKYLKIKNKMVLICWFWR